ncbi:MAG: pyridoxal phosphate-dependent decarboxylase family protein [Longimicrobiales bacterium]
MSEPRGFEIDADTMRQMGYRVVDALVARELGLDAEPVWRGATRPELEAKLREAVPSEAETFDRIMGQLLDDALVYGARVDHPRFLAYVPGSPTWPAVLADFVAAGLNVFQGSWLGGAGASEIELIVLDWFKEWLGYPSSAAGLFLSGGSAANLTALACARLARCGAHSTASVLYGSVEVHSSATRAARVLGFADDRVRRIPVDTRQRLDVCALEAALQADREAGLVPLAVVANAGATSTGAIDPLPELVDLCRRHDVWLHVDAAYGGFAVLTERGRAAMRGLEYADSITLDPHKWLFQPFEAGCLLVRDGAHLDDGFHISADYLQDARITDSQLRERRVNFMDRGIQLTRCARALKVWVSLKYFGVEPFRAAIDLALDLAEHTERRIVDSAEFELITPAALGIVCFRRVTGPDGTRITDRIALGDWNERLVNALAASGEGMISSTRVDGAYALRVCILSHRTRQSDVDRVLDWLATAQPESGSV